MKILFAASEMTPYAKTGGLGDVVGALPSALRQMGHEVTCCLPFYRCVRLCLEEMATAGQVREMMKRNPPPAPPSEGSARCARVCRLDPSASPSSSHDPAQDSTPQMRGLPDDGDLRSSRTARSGSRSPAETPLSFAANRCPTAEGPQAGTLRPSSGQAPVQPRGETQAGMPVQLRTLRIPLGDEVVSGDVLEWKQADGVRVLFVRCDEFFDREELYGTGDEDYRDNAERFLFFSKAVAELAGDPRFRPDVLHCHDWQTALVPVLMAQKQSQAGRESPRAAALPQRGSSPSGTTSLSRGMPGQPTAATGTVAPPNGGSQAGMPVQLFRTVFTIHNIAFQGIFPKAAFALTDLPRELFTPSALEFYGRMNLMKGGVMFADALTAVSRTYAKEIQTPKGGFGLDGVLKTRANVLHGILNGVDYECWNPTTDDYLKQRYSPEDLSGKQACKMDLLERLGMEGSGFRVQGSEFGGGGEQGAPTPSPSVGGEHGGPTPSPREGRCPTGLTPSVGGEEATKRRAIPTGRDACATASRETTPTGRDPSTKLRTGACATTRPPVVGFVSRLTEQKGVELLVDAIADLVRAGVMLAILGKGERKYEEMLVAAARRFSGQVAVKIAHDEELAHRIQAGADMLLVPSHFEPCGLTQLYALKYGTIPVVRATGGLDDTVAQYDEKSGRGTGFKFALYKSEALVEAVKCAILLYNQPKKWQKLMRNAMACDFSWQASAKEYEKLYAAL